MVGFNMDMKRRYKEEMKRIQVCVIERIEVDKVRREADKICRQGKKKALKRSILKMDENVKEIKIRKAYKHIKGRKL